MLFRHQRLRASHVISARACHSLTYVLWSALTSHTRHHRRHLHRRLIVLNFKWQLVFDFNYVSFHCREPWAVGKWSQKFANKFVLKFYSRAQSSSPKAHASNAEENWLRRKCNFQFLSTSEQRIFKWPIFGRLVTHRTDHNIHLVRLKSPFISKESRICFKLLKFNSKWDEPVRFSCWNYTTCVVHIEWSHRNELTLKMVSCDGIDLNDKPFNLCISA